MSMTDREKKTNEGEEAPREETPQEERRDSNIIN